MQHAHTAKHVLGLHFILSKRRIQNLHLHCIGRWFRRKVTNNIIIIKSGKLVPGGHPKDPAYVRDRPSITSFTLHQQPSYTRSRKFLSLSARW